MKAAFWISNGFEGNSTVQSYSSISVRMVILIICFCFGAISPLYAQIAGLKKGDRVKLDAPTVNTHRLVGNVTELSSSAVVLMTKDSAYVIPYASIEKLAISTGKRSRVGKGILWGALIGGPLGMIIAEGSYRGCNSNFGLLESFEKFDAIVKGYAVGSVSGLVIGAIIGAKVTDPWESMPVRLTMASELNRSQKISLNPTITVRMPLSGGNR